MWIDITSDKPNTAKSVYSNFLKYKIQKTTLHASFSPCIKNSQRLTDVRMGEEKYLQNFAREMLRK
jgi:hypothetical protein